MHFHVILYYNLLFSCTISSDSTTHRFSVKGADKRSPWMVCCKSVRAEGGKRKGLRCAQDLICILRYSGKEQQREGSKKEAALCTGFPMEAKGHMMCLYTTIVMWGQSWGECPTVYACIHIDRPEKETLHTLTYVYSLSVSKDTRSTPQCTPHCPTKASNSSPLSQCKLRWGL